MISNGKLLNGLYNTKAKIIIYKNKIKMEN